MQKEIKQMKNIKLGYHRKNENPTVFNTDYIVSIKPCIFLVSEDEFHDYKDWRYVGVRISFASGEVIYIAKTHSVTFLKEIESTEPFIYWEQKDINDNEKNNNDSTTANS